MADSNLQRSVTTATARRLATTTKTAPQLHEGDSIDFLYFMGGGAR